MRTYPKAHQWCALCNKHGDQVDDWVQCDSCGIAIRSKFLIFKGDKYSGKQDISPEGRVWLKQHPEVQTEAFRKQLWERDVRIGWPKL